MIQILPHTPSAGEMAAQNLGQGIGGAVEAYYQQKNENAAQQKKEAGIDQMIKQLGLPEDQASIIKGIALEKLPEKTGLGLLAHAARRKPSGVEGALGQQPSEMAIPSQEEISALAAWDPQQARLLQDERNAQLKSAASRDKQILPLQEAASTQLKTARNQIQALDTQLAAVRSGDVGVFSKANLSEFLDKAGYPTLAKAAQSEGGKVFKTGGKQIFAGAKNIFGAKVSNFEAGIFDSMMAQVGVNAKANELAIKSLMVPHLHEQEEARFKLDLIADHPEMSAVQVNNAVYRHMERYDEDLAEDWRNTLYQALELSEEKPQSKEPPKRSLSEILWGPEAA